jgi:hypothetical protein
MAARRGHVDEHPDQYPRDSGQIGAIIQTRLHQKVDGDKKEKEFLWCRNGSICFKLVKDCAESSSNYRGNERGQRRRVDTDDKLMLVTPDATGQLGNIAFVGISLTDIPCSPSSESLAARYPDACGRVALQISGIATVPLPQTELDALKDVKIGDHLSIDTRASYLMKFSEHETTLGLKKADLGHDKLHYVGMVCNMNLSPVTGPSIDILLCPQKFAVDMKVDGPGISSDMFTNDNLDKAWGKFEQEANSSNSEDAFSGVKNAISLLSGNNQRDELLRVIEDLSNPQDIVAECPKATKVSFYGKLALLLGVKTDENTLPGVGDALMNGKDMSLVANEIREQVKGDDLYDTETSAILCNSPKEVQWIKAWESWAKALDKDDTPWDPNLSEKLSKILDV